MKLKIIPTATLQASKAYKVYHNGVEAKYTTDTDPIVAEITAGLAAAIDPAAWVTLTSYAVGDYVTNDTTPIKNYICTKAGDSGATGPTGTGSGIEDGTCTWDYIGPKSAITATDNSTDVTVEADTVADAFTMYVADIDQLDIVDITPNGSPDGIVEDITAVRAINDDWYAAVLTNKGKAVITAAAAHIETLNKIMFVASLDSDILDSSVSDDIASTLSTASYDRTAVIYHYKANLQYADAAWLGLGLPYDPGSITWAFKELAGVDTMQLNPTRVTTLRSKSCNFYAATGEDFTQDGKVASGEWIDVIRTIDWTEARIQEGVVAALKNAKKIPFTDKGATQVQNRVEAVLREGVGNDAFRETPAPYCTVPKIADVSAADKANRLLPDVFFFAELAGAIHKTEIEGVVSV
jgi:hypothetical protein